MERDEGAAVAHDGDPQQRGPAHVKRREPVLDQVARAVAQVEPDGRRDDLDKPVRAVHLERGPQHRMARDRRAPGGRERGTVERLRPLDGDLLDVGARVGLPQCLQHHSALDGQGRVPDVRGLLVHAPAIRLRRCHPIASLSR